MKMKTTYLKLILLGAFFNICLFLSAQQRVVKIDGIVPGGDLVYDQIYNAITADAVNRAANKNVVYELRRGQVYLAISTINSTDYDLYIRAEAGTGPLPIIFHTLNAAGASANLITARQNMILENLEIDMRHSNGTLGNRVLNMYGKNYRCTLKGCRIINDRGGAISLQVDGVKFYMIDCIIGNMGHQISVGGNGRALDIRNTGTVDTVVFQNCTIYNCTDRVLRNMGPVITYVKLDHNTIYNIQGYHGSIQLGKTKQVVITNNIFANPLVYGDRFPARWRTEQLQPDKAFAVITHDSLSSKLTSATAVMKNNNIYFEQKFEDFFNATPPGDSIGYPRTLNNAMVGFLGSTLSQAYFKEVLTFKNVSSSQALYNFIIYWASHPKASVYPNNFSEIYPYEWDVSYSTSSTSYRAGDKGYPLGDLNAWPSLKALWATGATAPSGSYQEIVNQGFEISKNFPNPFAYQTTVNYLVTKPQKVQVNIFTSFGQKVKTLAVGDLAIGDYSVKWDGTDNSGASVPKGLYLLEISGPGGRTSTKIIKN
jgi:hypothetical protein